MHSGCRTSIGPDGATANGHDAPGGANGHGFSSNGSNGYGPNGLGGGTGHGGGQPVREPELAHAGARSEGGRFDGGRMPLLPKRVPSIPDVPDMFLPNDPAADGFELTRITSFLRDGRMDETDDRPDGFDVAAVLEAVRRVAGVSQAQLRWNSGYGHTLRIEFVDGANEAEVTREVSRMLRETMGLAASRRAPRSRPRRARSSGPAGRPPRPGAAPSGRCDRRPPGWWSTTQVPRSGWRRRRRPAGRLRRGQRRHDRQGQPAGTGGRRLPAPARRAAAAAVDEVDRPGHGRARGRCFVEHAAGAVRRGRGGGRGHAADAGSWPSRSPARPW
jgi:hypothetical protein